MPMLRRFSIRTFQRACFAVEQNSRIVGVKSELKVLGTSRHARAVPGVISLPAAGDTVLNQGEI